ncbi:hypothetical protein LSTR_LSTR006057 [Laodelphax striatellus]|uniref:Endonuclease/exonuclease/phosphatase domain-containing protein n=1 Tax=Laodelphax striatellus TaxID=195883 RepID=A0A482XPC4_LAOST|nr:hypothetical protein LSTR_LSTR006057 [Laodelphax striatellus]
MATRQSILGSLGKHGRIISENSGKLPSKTKTFIGTLNINTLIQTGKIYNLTQEMDRQRILILALQETRFTDSETTDYGNYRIFKSGTQKRVARGAPIFGMAFLVHRSIIGSVKEVTPVNNRLMTMRIQSANKKYTLINAHAPPTLTTRRIPKLLKNSGTNLKKL